MILVSRINTSDKGLIDLGHLLNKCYVYFLIKDGRVVYVGQSKTVGSRLATHNKQKQFDNVLALEVPEGELLDTESAFIRVIRPEYNGHFGKATEADHRIVRDSGVGIIGGKIHELKKLPKMEYGYCLYRFNGQLRVGFYDDDDFAHSEECDDHLLEIGLERDDLTDEAEERICKKHGCSDHAIVIDMDDPEYTVDIPYDSMFACPSEIEQRYENDVPEHIKKQREEWDALSPEEQAKQMREMMNAISKNDIFKEGLNGRKEA